LLESFDGLAVPVGYDDVEENEVSFYGESCGLLGGVLR
jgi:hypothetical protein